MLRNFIKFHPEISTLFSQRRNFPLEDMRLNVFVLAGTVKASGFTLNPSPPAAAVKTKQQIAHRVPTDAERRKRQ